MLKRFLSLVLCICMLSTLAVVTVSAAAMDISVKSAAYYDNGDVKSLNIDFGWDSAEASSRLVVMTERLRSAGEEGTDGRYGDFTDLGHYGRTFKSWDDVVAQSGQFGMVLYTDEHKMSLGENTLSLYLEQGDIPINIDKTYYIYLWTSWGGYCYPDNLFMVIQAKNGQLTYASATGRNEYGSFTALKGSAISTPAFQDVKKADYFFEPVSWAVDKGITSGTSNTTFSPDTTCTRAQILTFLWRAAGSPESTAKNFYSDVFFSDYFCDAALWAKEKGIYKPDGHKFGPNEPCTRASTVEYFWKAAGSPTVETVPFSDVPAGSELEKAVSWAVRKGITAGTGGTSFTPDTACTRAQIVTFLHRYHVAPTDNSALIKELKKKATQTVTSMVLDPNPPEDYTKQPDWYGTLTPPASMSDERLLAEYENIQKVIEDFRNRGIYMSDGPYSRKLDLWSEASRRDLLDE